MRLVLIATLSLISCDRERARPAATSSDVTKRVEPSKQIAPLVARLAYEARHRTASKLPAERVLDELAQNELSVTARRQYVGAALRATYCIGGNTSEGVAISVCEFASPTAAQEGLALMNERFAPMSATAMRAVRESTVLTVTDPNGSTSPRALRALETFAALSPQ